jgi:prefoldin subunit 5
VDTHINGSSHPDGADLHGANVIPMTLSEPMALSDPMALPEVGAGVRDADSGLFTDAVVATQSSLHAQVDDKMRELKSTAVALDQSLQDQQGAIQRYQASLQSVEQQALVAAQQAQAAAQQVQGVEERVQGVEQVLAEVGDQLTRTLDELRAKVSDITISIGELTEQVAALKEMPAKVEDTREEVEHLKSQVGSRRWIVWLVGFTIVVGGYIALDKPGWGLVTKTLGPWIPGLN